MDDLFTLYSSDSHWLFNCFTEAELWQNLCIGQEKFKKMSDLTGIERVTRRIENQKILLKARPVYSL